MRAWKRAYYRGSTKLVLVAGHGNIITSARHLPRGLGVSTTLRQPKGIIIVCEILEDFIPICEPGSERSFRDCHHVAVTVLGNPYVTQMVFQVIGFIDLGIGDGQFGPAAGVVVLGAGITHAAVFVLVLQDQRKTMVVLFHV